MTKKFWDSWKLRIGETKQIWIWKTCGSFRYSEPLIKFEDELVHVTFNDNDNDTATITVKVRRKIFNTRTASFIITTEEIKDHIIRRVDIRSIEFKKNKV